MSTNHIEPELSDADLAARVAVFDRELAKLVRARLRALRLRCIVTPAPTPAAIAKSQPQRAA